MGRGKGNKKGGRPRKFKTAAVFGRAVEAYFVSISREVTLREWVDTGERTAKGKAIYAERNLLGLDGKAVTRLEYIVPPTLSGLCLSLGITRETWSVYASGENDPDFAPICKNAKLRLETYLEEQLLSRERGVQGIMFNLQNNYGWRERREFELGAATRGAMASGMSIEDKFKLIHEAAAEFANDNGDTLFGIDEDGFDEPDG